MAKKHCSKDLANGVQDYMNSMVDYANSMSAKTRKLVEDTAEDLNAYGSEATPFIRLVNGVVKRQRIMAAGK